jgi:hypothetical protein
MCQKSVATTHQNKYTAEVADSSLSSFNGTGNDNVFLSRVLEEFLKRHWLDEVRRKSIVYKAQSSAEL